MLLLLSFVLPAFIEYQVSNASVTAIVAIKPIFTTTTYMHISAIKNVMNNNDDNKKLEMLLLLLWMNTKPRQFAVS